MRQSFEANTVGLQLRYREQPTKDGCCLNRVERPECLQRFLQTSHSVPKRHASSHGKLRHRQQSIEIGRRLIQGGPLPNDDARSPLYCGSRLPCPLRLVLGDDQVSSPTDDTVIQIKHAPAAIASRPGFPHSKFWSLNRLRIRRAPLARLGPAIVSQAGRRPVFDFSFHDWPRSWAETCPAPGDNPLYGHGRALQGVGVRFPPWAPLMPDTASTCTIPRLMPLFFAFWAENTLAYAVNSRHNRRKRCGDCQNISMNWRIGPISVGTRRA